MKKLYLSGPISGVPLEEARARFAAVEADLRWQGYEVLNPFNNGLHWSDPWGDHMKADIKMLLEADIIFMLEGWKESQGAQLELTIARALDMVILHQN